MSTLETEGLEPVNFQEMIHSIVDEIKEIGERLTLIENTLNEKNNGGE